MSSNCVQSNSDNRDSNKISDQMQDSDHRSGPSSSYGNRTPNAQPLCTESKPELDRGKKRDLSKMSRETTDVSTTKKLLQPQTKRPRTDLVSGEYRIRSKTVFSHGTAQLYGTADNTL